MALKEGFLWGGAVAAHQLEGGYLEGGKGLSIMDVTTAGDRGDPQKDYGHRCAWGGLSQP